MKSPKVVADRAFSSFLALVFITLIFGGFLVYKYVILVGRLEPEITERPIRFKENLYQEVLAEWESRQKRFEEVEKKEYPDPFRRTFPERVEEGVEELTE